jgi:hypothetical protein
VDARHVFNGTDLQVKRFRLVVDKQNDTPRRQLLGGLQQLAWEQRRRRKGRPHGNLHEALAGAAAMQPAAVTLAKDEGYVRTSAAHCRAESTKLRQCFTPGSAAAQALIREMPASYTEYLLRKPGPGAAAAPGGADVAGLIDFVIQNFQYRYVSAHDYLVTFSRGATRKIDLLVASLVDYDWWLAKGEPTPSSLREQVELMGQIAIATGGRVHAFVPFDPFREVMARGTFASALTLVKDAVTTHGAMGVKLYPPMGFAPFGNAGAMIWKAKDWLPDVTYGDQFGTQLDTVLAEFFSWCIEEEVPVMAHANRSNGPDPEFENLALADRWKIALERLDRDRAASSSTSVFRRHHARPTPSR